MTPTVGRAAPRANARAVQRLGTHAPWAGGPVQLMVLGSKRDANNALWLRVQLAKRPNGSSAWVLADHVRLWRTPWRIEVQTASRTVTVRRAGKLVRRFRAVVGAPGTPTPHGLFAVAERFDRASPNDFYGPHVLALTAFSNVFETFGGGPGIVGIHGRGGASLATPLGHGRLARLRPHRQRADRVPGARRDRRHARRDQLTRARRSSRDRLGASAPPGMRRAVANPGESARRTVVSPTNRETRRKDGIPDGTESRPVCFVGKRGPAIVSFPMAEAWAAGPGRPGALP